MEFCDRDISARMSCMLAERYLVVAFIADSISTCSLHRVFDVVRSGLLRSSISHPSTIEKWQAHLVTSLRSVPCCWTSFSAHGYRIGGSLELLAAGITPSPSRMLGMHASSTLRTLMDPVGVPLVRRLAFTSCSLVLFSQSIPFRRESDADGLRGKVFVSDGNSTVVISFKGGSPPWICDQTCVKRALVNDEGLYYPIDADIWLVGSLGGAMGLTFGAPAVAFESPGDKLAAIRLHFSSPPSTIHITHVYHTGDPLAQGMCTSITSVCAIGRFALESRCHTGQRILYDTVGRRGWVHSHGIQLLIENLFNEDWEQGGVEVPGVDEEMDCVDCPTPSKEAIMHYTHVLQQVAIHYTQYLTDQ
ncbi:hypothetical protein DFH07DRAFT_959680 [Mycena maculata]|uniref:triacylglycerol lipase n=1 Tax=Mycena maculata TaxID=230809 RepID=A0AAD7J0U5_9AGAR|nr:hypothetical protein DFH07DRAFT_959680 [Mycena maculata]